jgi:protein TonB
MTEDSRPIPPKPAVAPRPVDDSGNGAWKWLVGVAATVAVLVGGYLVVKSLPPTQPATEVAATDPGYDLQSSTAPAIVATPAPAADDAATAAVVAPEPTTKKVAPRPAPRPAVVAPVTPTEVIGVQPAALEGDADEIIVTPGRRPVWSYRPSAKRLSALYPARALERGREGEASVHCTVLADGALDCVRVSETPAHAGFGNAALRVARTFRHAPQRADGSTATGTPVDLRVIFRVADEDRRRS